MTTQTICMGKDKKREIMKTIIQVRLESFNNPKLHNLQVWPIIYWSLSIYKIISVLRNKKDLHLILLVINKELKKLLVMPRLKNGSSVEEDAILKNSALRWVSNFSFFKPKTVVHFSSAMFDSLLTTFRPSLKSLLLSVHEGSRQSNGIKFSWIESLLQIHLSSIITHYKNCATYITRLSLDFFFFLGRYY